ncbi:The fantastic four family [Parasponia andersonii]|uniref:The fantastic four family n=1 Tax=Parasponia andersonii TaxID=3476 RepID=A0A2P5C2L4_PARAD|nr:The fantastic four family [Parasponia andersonii]
MSTSVCQGLQSCLEPGLVESRVLRLKLALPKTNPTRSSAPNCLPCVSSSSQPQQTPQNDENDNVIEVSDKKPVDVSGWSFLQALANTKNDPEPEKVYVHPMVKRSASMLSAKSLEMCTESLGSETGSDNGDSSGDEMSLLSVQREAKSSNRRQVQAPKRYLNRSTSFPPPLTSVSGSPGFQVRPHREDGRLVLKAVIVSSARSSFHAERVDGRLRLRLIDVEAEEEEEEEEEVEEEEEEVVEEDGVETEVEDEEENREDGDETEEVLLSGDMEGHNGNAGDEMGNGKLCRPRGCKEDGRGNMVLMNWEQFLVAT